MPHTAPVEARSLISLTNLAANPPAYPRNPTQKPLEPLVLYIVRVPGSKDVFLSPLKPPTKASVSPESLNASLYFLHVSGPQDEAVLETIEQEQQQTSPHHGAQGRISGQNGALAEDPKFAALNRVRRKPVPSMPAAVSSSTTTEQQETRDEEPPPPVLPPRPLRQDYDGGQEGKRQISPSRPLPALPPDDDEPPPPYSPGTAGLDARNERRGSAQEPEEERPPLPPRPPRRPIAGNVSPGRVSWDGGRRPQYPPPPHAPDSNNNSNARGLLAPYDEGPEEDTTARRSRLSYDGTRETSRAFVPSPFNITLIRRDPTHGNQWNVGTITNASTTTPSEVAVDGSVAVEITTPGYKRFIDTDVPVTLESLQQQQNQQQQQQPPSTSSPHSHPNSSSSNPPTGPAKFVRRVHLPTPSASKHARGRGHYTFSSPWGRACTFIPGANGRSLRCKHSQPVPQTGPESGSTTPDTDNATTVAEIRFNLPIFGPAAAAGSSSSPSSPNSSPHRRSHAHAHGRTPSSPGSAAAAAAEPPPIEPGRLDLRLGREKAGGGLRGHSAKLGKLIIEDEGLKMLDLVVAACMGVWWGVYNRG